MVGDVSRLKPSDPGGYFRLDGRSAAILANRLYTNIFRLLVQRPDKSENQVRCAGFPKD